jgi:acid stress-induced BolA-like protein IbaG/YrbA
MLTANRLKDYILEGLNCDHVEVQGDDGQHFQAVIVSSDFVGKNRIQQHQMVYQSLGDRMRSEIHALAMRTFTPDAWANLNLPQSPEAG